MRRLHLFEWEDQPWLPAVWRDFITDHLRYTSNEPMRRPVNAAVAERLRSVVARTGVRRIVDLCAGAGGPLIDISAMLADEAGGSVEIVLTDLYPNVSAFRRVERESNGRIQARYAPTNAFDVPADLDGVRTLFTALHHFTPEQVNQVLADAVRKAMPIAVFEPLERSMRMVALVGLMSLARGFTHTPRVGRLTLARAVFTYVVPVAPLLFAWDGMVSAIRTYTPDELLAMASSATGNGSQGPGGGYRWEAGRFEVDGPYGPMPTTYLLGMPAQSR